MKEKKEKPKLKPAQRAAADQAWQAASALLDTGAQGAELLLNELQRAMHSCRAAGLHRLSAAGLRAAQQLRDLHDRRPEFRLANLSADVYQLLLVAHAIRTTDGEVDARWIGQARRGYAQVGSLRVWGLYTEAVASTSGYAGAVTYLVSEDGTLWSIGDVAPGDVERCHWSYVTPFELGGVSLSHRALARGALRLENATAAANHRLGTGQRLEAEVLDGVAWSEPPLAQLWVPSLRALVDRAWSARTEDNRRAGDDLLFLRGRVLGADRDALLLEVGDVVLNVVAPSAHARLHYRHNLQLLASTAGSELLVIGRTVYARPRTVELLAIGGGTLALPEEWRGRVNLGLDRLQTAHLPAPVAAQGIAQVPEAPADPLLPLERRLEQVLLGGRAATSSATWPGLLRDEAALQRAQLRTAAAVLRRLREYPSAEAWLAARVYLAAAQAHLQRENWLA